MPRPSAAVLRWKSCLKARAANWHGSWSRSGFWFPTAARSAWRTRASCGRWERAAAWIAENREGLRIRARVALAAGRYRAEGEDDELLLPPGKPLAEAVALWTTRPRMLAPDLHEYIRRSQARQLRAERRKRRGMQITAAVFAALSLVAASAAVFSYTQSRQAQRNADAAQQAEGLANQNAARADDNARLAENRAAAELAAKQQAQRLLVESYIDRGIAAIDRGDQASGLAIFGQAYAISASASLTTLQRSSLLTASHVCFVDVRLRHADGVGSLAFSPDGTRIATASWDHTARLWDAATGKPLGEPMTHGDLVECVAFNPDGMRIATASADHTARLWDGATGKPLGAPIRHNDTVDYVAFSPDGKRVATGSADHTARLWDAATGNSLGAPMKHANTVFCLAFSPDGMRIATASADHTARLWDAATQKPLGEAMKHNDGVLCLVFSPDGTRIATAGRDHTARLWDATTGKSLGEPMKHDDAVPCVAFSPDGTRIATASDDHRAPLGRRDGRPARRGDDARRRRLLRGLQPGRHTHCHGEPRPYGAAVGRRDAKTARPADEAR